MCVRYRPRIKTIGEEFFSTPVTGLAYLYLAVIFDYSDSLPI